jgi:hypothetical protein
MFVWLGIAARRPAIRMDLRWLMVLVVVLLGSLLYAGAKLRRETGFS